MPESIEPEYLNEHQIRVRFLPIGSRTLARWISAGDFPPPDFRMGNKIRLWKVSTVQNFMAEHSAVEVR